VFVKIVNNIDVKLYISIVTSIKIGCLDYSAAGSSVAGAS